MKHKQNLYPSESISMFPNNDKVFGSFSINPKFMSAKILHLVHLTSWQYHHCLFHFKIFYISIDLLVDILLLITQIFHKYLLIQQKSYLQREKLFVPIVFKNIFIYSLNNLYKHTIYLDHIYSYFFPQISEEPSIMSPSQTS